MKKRLSVLAVLVMAVAITAYSVTGTYAKYTSTASNTSTARVAKWSFTVGDTDIATTTSFDFDLFESVNDSHVTTGENENIIAPGTSGSFDIELTNESEVDATYAIDYTVTNTNSIPVEFSIDGGTTWTTTLADVSATDINKDGGETTITVQWRWAYNSSDSTNYTSNTDATDTAFGVKTTADTLSVKAEITATQVD